MNDTPPPMFCETVFYCTAHRYRQLLENKCAHYKRGKKMWCCAHDHDGCGKCDNPIAQVQALYKALKDRGVDITTKGG